MIRFQINEETPSKKNSRIVLANGKNIPSARHMKWHKEAKNTVQWQAILQAEGSEFTLPIEEEVKIKLTFVHGDKRRRDSDNGTSSIFDLLTDCGVLKDDCWNIIRHFEVFNEYDKNAPRCIIEISKWSEK